MFECQNFSNTLKVSRCGTKIYLGDAAYTEGMMILVTYYLNGEEVSDYFNPIVDGNKIYLDLQEPFPDYYSPYNTYYISLTDVSGYFSNGTPLANNGNTHDGFIVNFSDAKNSDDRLIAV